MRQVVFLGLALIVAACSQASDEGETAAPAPEAFEETASEQPVTQAPTSEPSFGLDPRPVQIGFDGPEFDACGSYGEITALNPQGDNFLSVRAAPDVQAEELDRLTTGTGVSMCESVDGWIGIVYRASGAKGTDCGVGSPVPSVRNYDGACRSGWVSERFVELIAG